MRHGKPQPVWRTVLWILSVGCLLAAFVLLLIINPGKPAPACRYTSGSVTLDVNGPGCNRILRFITDDSDRPWGISTYAPGSAFTVLTKGPDSVTIYNNGDRAFAVALLKDFQKAQWTVESPAPTPAPS